MKKKNEFTHAAHATQPAVAHGAAHARAAFRARWLVAGEIPRALAFCKIVLALLSNHN